MLGELSGLHYLLFKTEFDCPSPPLWVILESGASIREGGVCLTQTSIFVFLPIGFLIWVLFGIYKLLLETVAREFFVSNSFGTFFWLREDKLLYVTWVDFAWEY